MSKVNVEELLDELSAEVRASLEQAPRQVAPASAIDLQRPVAVFKREMARRHEPWYEPSEQSIRLTARAASGALAGVETPHMPAASHSANCDLRPRNHAHLLPGQCQN